MPGNLRLYFVAGAVEGVPAATAADGASGASLFNAMFSIRTFTPGSPRKPRSGWSVCCLINSSTFFWEAFGRQQLAGLEAPHSPD